MIKKNDMNLKYKFISLLLILFLIVHVMGFLSELNSRNVIQFYTIIVIQFLIEIFIIFQSSIFLWTISNYNNYEDPKLADQIEDYPEIDVMIAIRYVEPEILKKTLVGFNNTNYPNEKLNIYLADDTPDDKLSNIYKELAVEYSANYYYNPLNKMYKAGILNLLLNETNSEYVAFFDYDHIPKPDILEKMIKVLIQNPNKSFVQAKKQFGNYNKYYMNWASLLYIIYFEILQKIKQNTGTVMFAGSTACFRREAIESVGGFPENTFTEDVALATKLLVNGRSGLFVNFYGSYGTVPNTFEEHISQLWRWSHGGAQVLKTQWMSVIKSKKLNLGQKLNILSLFAITPSIFMYYIYSFSFIPLFLERIDPPRMTIFGFSSLILIPIIPTIVYLALINLTLIEKNDELTRSRIYILVKYLIIGLSTIILICKGTILGLIGLRGPNSSKGDWNYKENTYLISIISCIVGVLLIVFSLDIIIDGIYSALMLFIVGFSLLPVLPIVIYQNIMRAKAIDF